MNNLITHVPIQQWTNTYAEWTLYFIIATGISGLIILLIQSISPYIKAKSK